MAVGQCTSCILLHYFDQVFTSRVTMKKNYFVLFALNQKKIYWPSRPIFFPKKLGQNSTIVNVTLTVTFLWLYFSGQNHSPVTLPSLLPAYEPLFARRFQPGQLFVTAHHSHHLKPSHFACWNSCLWQPITEPVLLYVYPLQPVPTTPLARVFTHKPVFAAI